MVKSTRSPKFTVLVYLIQVQYIWLNHIYKLFQEYSMIDPPDLSPGSSPWDTNRTNRTRSSGGKYESAPFLTPAPKWHIKRNKVGSSCWYKPKSRYFWAYFEIITTFIGLIGQNPRSIHDQKLITQTPNLRHVWHIIDTLLTVWWQMLSFYKYPVTKPSSSWKLKFDHQTYFWSSGQLFEGRTCLLHLEN